VTDDFLTPRAAERLARAARAAQTLSETLWEALHEELGDPRAHRVAELSERLADVSAIVTALARGDARPAPAAEGSRGATPDVGGEVPAAQPESPTAPVEPRSRLARVTHDEPSSDEPSSQREPPAQQPPSVAVLVDELAPQGPPPELAPQGSPAQAQSELAPQGPPAQAPSEIEIRDARGERAQAAWIAAIGRRLERYERDGVPFAVLLVELADVERLRHSELPGEVARMTGLVETALAGELRPADSLTRESPGRYWLLAPETDSGSARALAGRLAEAVRGAASHRGAPLQVAVGIAVCPTDGSQAGALAVHADVALYAARAAGRPVA
jgi:GGDEF domain-containing protein